MKDASGMYEGMVHPSVALPCISRGIGYKQENWMKMKYKQQALRLTRCPGWALPGQ